jgi:hypothetical protein
MRISNLRSYALSTSIALAALAGCGSGSQIAPTPLMQPAAASASIQRPPALQGSRGNGFLAMRARFVPGHATARPSFMDPKALGKPLVFVSYGGTIDIYLQGGKNKLVGQVTGPNGYDLATDTASNLYSANTSFSGSGNVTIYEPPYTKGPKLTLSTREPQEVAVSRQGTVAVGGCTIASGSQCGYGVVFYAPGSTTPCATVPLYPSPFTNGFFGIAFDRKGNLYVDSAGSGTEAPLTVGRIAGGCNAKKIKTFTTANAIAYAGDIKVDKAGRIAIVTATGTGSYTDAIDTYDPPNDGSLGSPVLTTPLTSNVDGWFAFTASGRTLWASYSDVGPSYAPGASELAYPGTGTPEKTVVGTPDTYAYGVAVTPALIP